MHFYESSIIMTKDGMHCQVYGNEHPLNFIIVKPKYIPTDKIECSALQYRFISGKRMNRLNMWADKEKLKKYIEDFKKAYPDYILKSTNDENRLIFCVPIDKIERIYFPKRGFGELMKIEEAHLDAYLKKVKKLGQFILQSGLKEEEIGITYSTLMGHYFSDKSDINLVIYGKQNFWKLMSFLENAQHPMLKWKTDLQWLDFRKGRNRANISTEEEFLKSMSRKKSEGYFDETLFVIFCAENEEERWFHWNNEKYSPLGLVKVRGKVKNNFSSVVRPGVYEISDSKVLEGNCDFPIEKIAFHSRDYCMIANPSETIEACGLLEKVESKDRESYYRVVVGYFDAYISDRREKEYLKLVLESAPKNRLAGEDCVLCKEYSLEVGAKTPYGAKIIYKIGSSEKDGWYATLSPKTGGDTKKTFSIQLVPFKHLRYFSEIADYPELALNYGLAFSKLMKVTGDIIKHENLGGSSEKIPIGTYGKCKHPNEHAHIKIFPWVDKIGQPYTIDSSFEKKQVFTDSITGEQFVKMQPVQKIYLPEQRFEELSAKFISLLNSLFPDIEKDYESIKKLFQEKNNGIIADKIADELLEHKSLFKQVFKFLIASFNGQLRRDNKTPLVFHSIYLVRLLSLLGERDLDTFLIAALHDVLEDTSVTEKQLREFLGEKSSIVDFLKTLKENSALSREPDGINLPSRYQEHISRIIGAPKQVVNVEIVDRFCDLMDLDYIENLSEKERELRMKAKSIKVRGFVENITRNREDFNKNCLSLFIYKLIQFETKWNILPQQSKIIDKL